MFFNRYLLFIFIVVLTGVSAPLAFTYISVRKIAALVAASQFCLWPLLISFILYKKPSNRLKFDLFLIIGSLQFWTLFAMPIFILRIWFWNHEFGSLSIPALSLTANQLHQYSMYSYILMLVLHVLLYIIRIVSSLLQNKKKFVCIATFFFASSSVISFLQIERAQAATEISIGTNLSAYFYKEELTAPAKSTETSFYPTVLASVAHKWGLFSKVQLSFDGMNNVVSQYDGSSLETNTPILALNRLSFSESNVAIQLGLTNFFGVFFGYGRFLWNRKLSGNPGYREIYSWNYSAVGVAFRLLSTNETEIILEASARKMQNAWIRVITSETVSGGVDSEMKLGSRPYNKLSVSWVRKRSYGSITIAPWVEKSGLEQSDVVVNSTLAPNPGEGIYEPSSNTTRGGIELFYTLRLW